MSAAIGPAAGTGSTDLRHMLAALEVSIRPGVFTFVSGSWPDLESVAAARIDEAEGVTLVVETAAARSAGAPVGFEAAWLTIGVHSALSAVGLTAWLSAVLAEAGIACNVLAGYHHDHLLVPLDRADEAAALLVARSSPVDGGSVDGGSVEGRSVDGGSVDVEVVGCVGEPGEAT